MVRSSPISHGSLSANPPVLSTDLRALTAHSVSGYRVHQLGTALLTIALDAAHAQSLSMLLTTRANSPARRPRRGRTAGAPGQP